MNASFDGRPVRLRLESDHMVLIDPIALDGLSSQLAEIGEGPEADQLVRLHALSEHGLRIGVQRVGGTGPGTYDIGLDSFESADPGHSDPRVFDVDTGTVILIDLAALSAVARALTWDRYDALLQAPVGDKSILDKINREVGGPRFAIVSADAESPFTGDGAFQLRVEGLVPSTKGSTAY